VRWLPICVVVALAGCATAVPARRATRAPAATSGYDSSRHATASPEVVEATATADPEVAAITRAFIARLTVWTRPDGTRVLSRRCREGPVDCEARLRTFARLIVRTARRHELDPYLLAALAMRESGLNPASLGARGEAGIVQLHPRGAGRDMRYVNDSGYREACQAQLDACQAPVLERGATYLAAAIEDCGGLEAGLGKYASGRCTTRGVHPRRVLEERQQLRRLARP